MTTTRDALQVVRQRDAHAMAEFGYYVFDGSDMGKRWHVVSHTARLVCASFDTRRAARAYVRDMAGIFA